MLVNYEISGTRLVFDVCPSSSSLIESRQTTTSASGPKDALQVRLTMIDSRSRYAPEIRYFIWVDIRNIQC